MSNTNAVVPAIRTIQTSVSEENDGANQIIEGLKIPGTYFCYADGVYCFKKNANLADFEYSAPSIHINCPLASKAFFRQILSFPVWISRKATHPDLAEVLVEMSWCEGGNVKRSWVPIKCLTSKYHMTKLVDYGLTIFDSKSTSVQVYLEKLLHSGIPEVRLNLAMGGVRSSEFCKGWVWGHEWIGDKEDETVVHPSPHLQLSAYKANGSEHKWWRKFDELEMSHGFVARWLNYSAFAAPLLRLFGQNSFVINHYSSGSHGKRALAQFAMSVWGDGAALTHNFVASDKMLDAQLSMVSDYPVALANINPREAKRHNIVQRLRNACDPGRNQNFIVARVTGEGPLHAQDGIDNSGHVVDIRDSTLTRNDAQKLSEWLAQWHFGHAGPWFLRNLHKYLKDSNNVEDIKNRLKDTSDILKDREYLGIVSIAQYLVETWRNPDADVEETWSRCLLDAEAIYAILMTDDTPESSILVEAVQALVDDNKTSPSKWFDLDSVRDSRRIERRDYEGVRGIYSKKKNEVWVIPTVFKQLMNVQKLNLADAWKALKDEGIARPGSKVGSRTYTRKHGPFKAGVHVLDYSKLFRKD